MCLPRLILMAGEVAKVSHAMGLPGAEPMTISGKRKTDEDGPARLSFVLFICNAAKNTLKIVGNKLRYEGKIQAIDSSYATRYRAAPGVISLVTLVRARNGGRGIWSEWEVTSKKKKKFLYIFIYYSVLDKNKYIRRKTNPVFSLVQYIYICLSTFVNA